MIHRSLSAKFMITLSLIMLLVAAAALAVTVR